MFVGQADQFTIYLKRLSQSPSNLLTNLWQMVGLIPGGGARGLIPLLSGAQILGAAQLYSCSGTACAGPIQPLQGALQ